MLCSAGHGKSLFWGFFLFQEFPARKQGEAIQTVGYLCKKICPWQRGFQKKKKPSSGHILIQEISCVLQLCSSIVLK